MPLQEEFRSIMNDIVTIEPYAGQDLQNKATFGPPLTYRSRISERVRLIRDQNGNQVVSMTKVNMDPTTVDGTSSLINPSVRARLTLPSGKVAAVISVGTSRDDVGVHHYVWYC